MGTMLSERYWVIFFEVYEPLPRQGPGNREQAVRALSLCTGLPSSPEVIDLGCGSGGQTLHLAELTAGTITAVDSHAPSVERLRAAVAERGLSSRIRPLVGDMREHGQPEQSFDLVWSEGALYNIGIAEALRLAHGLLRPGGYLVFTEAVWRKPDPPPRVRESFAADYPAMGTVADLLALVERSALSLVGHFTLPDEAWWDDFYAPMQLRIEELRLRYEGDDEALGILDQLAEEPAMHRAHGDCYGYELVVARR